ncbi:MAG: redoxin family protein [Akkermansiaceae bacterium]|nr:redoxin family protein [Armatimonadota bacterium]
MGRYAAGFTVALLLWLNLASAPAPKPAKPLSLPPFADLSGKRHILVTDQKPSTTVFVFLATDCPVASRTAPGIARLAKRYAKRGVRFFAVYPNELESDDGVLRHARDRGLLTALPVVRDASGNLTRTLGAGFTPEAVLVSANGAVLYRGNVESLVVPLDASLSGKPVRVTKTGVAGCALRLAARVGPPSPAPRSLRRE